MEPCPAPSFALLGDALAFDGPGRALEFLDLFAGVLEGCLTAIDAAPADTPAAVLEPAHKLKGSAAMFRDDALSAAAAGLERAAKTGDPGAIAAARAALIARSGETRERLAADRAVLVAAAGAAA